MMQLYFRTDEHSVRWVWTDGLQALGQQEIAVQLSWPAGDPRDRLVTLLLHFLENYVASQTTRILPAETLRYGWSLLRFVNDEQQISGAGPGALLIEENEHPFSQDAASFELGVARTLALHHLQNEAMQRNHVTGDAIYPSASQLALVCAQATPATIGQLRPLMAHRNEEPAAQWSGWFIGCCDDAHDHDDPDELAPIHLLHLVEQFPGLFPYLAMPVGSQLLFEETRAIIFHPDEESGQIDPGQLLTALPL